MAICLRFDNGKYFSAFYPSQDFLKIMGERREVYEGRRRPAETGNTSGRGNKRP
jgi:hypothetical protein